MVRKINNWYGPGFWTRRDPQDAAINITQTRWRKDDLSGYLIQRAKEDKQADQPHILKIPAIVDEATAELLNEMSGHPLLSPRLNGERKPYRFKAGDSFAPRRFPIALIHKARATNPAQFEALYQQNPTSAEGAILKRRCWRKWQDRTPPACFMIVQFYDTNFEEDEIEANSYAARSTWGLFEWDGDGAPRVCAILLEAWRGRPSFPELMELAKLSRLDFDADLLVIEKKANGHAMLQECRKRGVPCKAFNPLMKSKTARASKAAVVLENGNLFYMDRPFAQPVIDECADFPTGDYDDWADTVVMCGLYLRTYYLSTQDEENERREKEALEKHFDNGRPAQLA